MCQIHQSFKFIIISNISITYACENKQTHHCHQQNKKKLNSECPMGDKSEMKSR